jgi:hypothetical protein
MEEMSFAVMFSSPSIEICYPVSRVVSATFLNLEAINHHCASEMSC